MDADFLDRRRSGEISQREKRWSMNSQRLEEIVAELMKPISDVRRSFDTDLSALLEEYLTEAGLHALEASEEDGVLEDGMGAGVGAGIAPNFTELALLLQHSASVYGRKVDFLYQHVLSVSDSLQNSAQEVERADEAGAEGGSKRRRVGADAGAGAGFQPLELTACGGSAREAGAPRPPPTLPRVYIELEPRRLAPGDRVCHDYGGEPVGLLADFHVAWRLQEGMLVDELEGWDGGAARSLRPIPLMELQAAIQAGAPPALPPRAPTPPPADPAPPPSCPATPPPPEPGDASTPLPLLKKERKRRNETPIDDPAGGRFEIVISKKARRRLAEWREFSVEAPWRAAVVQRRARRLLRLRARIGPPHATDFRGFESSQLDIGGFGGWSREEVAEAAGAAVEAAVAAVAAGALAETTGAAEGAGADSDDDGFFEQSSLGDSDTSRIDDTILLPPTTANTPSGGIDDSVSWQADVAARAAAAAARALDVRAEAARVLRALPRAGAPAAAATLLRDTARHPHEVAGLFLATLFLANAGNVEIVPGPPLTLDSFSVRLVTADPRLYCAAPAPDPGPGPSPR